MEKSVFTIPEGHHPGRTLAMLAARRRVTAKDFSANTNISYQIIKRFFSGEIGVHPSTVAIIADAARYFLGVQVDEDELLRAQQSFLALVSRQKALSRAALTEALKDIELPVETRHERTKKWRKEQEVLHAAAMKRKEAK